MANTLTVQSIPPSPEDSACLLASVSVAPTDNVPVGTLFFAAEVLYPDPLPCEGEQDGDDKKRYLYASNRNKGTALDPRGDTIAIVEHCPGDGKDKLTVVNQVYTGLQQIRSMTFSDDEQYLVAGGGVSGGVKVYKWTDGGKGLEEVASNKEVDTRTNFVWVAN